MRIIAALAPVAVVVMLAGCAASTPPEPSASKRPTPTSTIQSVTVPDVTGLPGDEAAARLRAAGFEVQPFWGAKRTVDSPLFDVLSQTPSAGVSADRGATIELSVGEPPLPAHTVERITDTLYTVTVDQTITQRDAHWLVREVADAETVEGGYFVNINCAVGGTSAVDNRQANGKFAIGTRGAAITGLSQGQSEAELLAGATCP